MAITPTDFDKIWSTNASTPEYTFSDADYLEGWDFVGNLPPTRAQWNAIQKRTDEKMKYVFDNFGAPLIAPTVADMTLQNRVYVYTGSEVGYTAGDWYYYDTGTSAWVDGGVYNAIAVQTDTTLTQAGVPADAKATGDAIALKPDDDPTLTISGAVADSKVVGDFTKSVADYKIVTSLFSIGALVASSGAETPNTARMRSNYLDKNVVGFKVNSGYNYLIFAYQQDGTYVGMWNGSAWSTTAVWLTDVNIDVFLKALNPSYIYRLVFKRTDSANIDLSVDADEVTFIFSTDKTLSVEGSSADAGVVGDKFGEITSGTDNIFDPQYLMNVNTWSKDGDAYKGTISALRSAYNTTSYPATFESNTRYTFSFQGKTSGNDTTAGNGIRAFFRYSDSTTDYATFLPNTTNTYTEQTLTSRAGKTVVGLCFDYGSGGNNIWYLKDIQLEKGTSATAYVPYLSAVDYVARKRIDDISTEDIKDVYNIYSIFTASKGIIASDGSIVNAGPITKEWMSDYIPVDFGQTYTFLYGASITDTSFTGEMNLWRAWAFYDSNKDFISRTVQNYITTFNDFQVFRNSFTVPSGVAYVRINARHYDNGFMMLFNGSQPKPPYLFAGKDSIRLQEYKNDFAQSDALLFGNNIKSVNHAGWYEAPEDTLIAYKQSKQHKFFYVETDISFTSDNVPVLLHDSTINRTARNTDGTELSEPINIGDITYAEALEYDFGIYKGDEYAGTKIPTLEQFVILCRNIGLHPYLELKGNDNYTQAQIESCVDIVKKCGMSGKVTWISFNSTFLQYVKNYDDSARLGYVVSGVNATVITTAQGLKTANNEVFIDSSSYTDSAVELCLNADLPMEVWTIGVVSTIKNLNPYITGVTSGNLNASIILYEDGMQNL